jgi:hypothetical protein
MWEKKKKKGRKEKKRKEGTPKNGTNKYSINVTYIYNKIHNERIIWKTLNEESSEFKKGRSE